MRHPTLLCFPALRLRGRIAEEHVLPLDVDAYRVVEGPEGWKVCAPDGALVYFRPGPGGGQGVARAVLGRAGWNLNFKRT